MRSLVLRLAVTLGVLVSVRPASAEIVFMASGRTISVKSHRNDGESVVLTLRSGGEVRLDRNLIDKIESDEPPSYVGLTPKPSTNKIALLTDGRTLRINGYVGTAERFSLFLGDGGVARLPTSAVYMILSDEPSARVLWRNEAFQAAKLDRPPVQDVRPTTEDSTAIDPTASDEAANSSSRVLGHAPVDAPTVTNEPVAEEKREGSRSVLALTVEQPLGASVPPTTRPSAKTTIHTQINNYGPSSNVVGTQINNPPPSDWAWGWNAISAIGTVIALALTVVGLILTIALRSQSPI